MRIETARKIRCTGWVLFGVYVISLVYFLFFSEKYGRLAGGTYRYNLCPLKEIRRFWIHRETLGMWPTLLNLGGNVIGFMPFSAILPVMNRKLRRCGRMVLITFLFSIAVELAQLVTQAGCFDVDDILLNTLGGLLGYIVFALCNQIRRWLYG